MALESGRSKERAEIQIEIKHLTHQLITRGSAVSLVWVPGHTALRGNESADKCAKEAARGERSVTVPMKLSPAETTTVLTKGAWQKYLTEMTRKGWWDLTPPAKKCVAPPGPIPVKVLIHRLKGLLDVQADRTGFWP